MLNCNQVIEQKDQKEYIGYNDIGYFGTLGILALGILL